MKKLLIVLFVTVLLLSGCSSKPKTVSGTFKGTGSGIAGDVTVEITVEDDVITACTVDVSGETASYGGAHKEDFETMIVEANGGAIDGIAGCTFTSNGIKDAYSAALKEAGLAK